MFFLFSALFAMASANTAPYFVKPTMFTPGAAVTTYNVCIGGTVKFTMRAVDPSGGSENVATIQIAGVPEGAITSPNTYPNDPDKSTVERTFEWKPQHTTDDDPDPKTNPDFKIDEMVCFTANDNNNGEVTGQQMSGEKCVKIRKRYYPSFNGDTPPHEHNHDLYIDDEYVFTVEAHDLNELDSVSILVDEDPGLPNGAVVGKQECLNQEFVTSEGDDTVTSPCNPARRVFSWRPIVGQEGPVSGGVRTYSVCFHVRDNKDSCTAGGYYNPSKRCVNIMVHAPHEEWVQDTPEEGTKFTAYVSRTMRGGARPNNPTDSSPDKIEPDYRCDLICYKMESHSKEGYYQSEIFHWWTTVDPAAPATRSDTYPYKPAAGDEYEGSRSAVYTSETDNHLIDGDLPQGATVIELEAEPVAEGEVPTKVTSKRFCWRPVRGQEARTYTTCYETRDTYKIDIAQRCVSIEVARCKYCTQPGDTMLNIAVDYNTDWLQLWGANVDVKNPDHLYDYQLLNVGPVYHVRAGDSLDNLAARFHTTPDEILSVNPDVDGIEGDGAEHSLEVGQALCIMPGICTFTDYHLQRD